MDEKAVRKARLAYERECADTAIAARKALLACLAREAKGQTLH